MRSLDPEEIKALNLFARGRSAEEIAAALHVSKSVVQHNLRVAARKLGARNRVHAILLGIRHGVIDPSSDGD